MKHLVTTALMLTASLFAPRLIAQAASATPPAATQPKAVATEPTPPTIKFDVVLLKRCAPNDSIGYNTISTGDSWQRHCQTIKTLLNLAYGGSSTFLVKGEPDWADTDPYDFVAKVAPEDAPTWQKMDVPTKRLMVRAVLPDILNLKVHTEIQSRPIYNLVVAKGGANLTPSKPDPNAPTDPQTPVRGSFQWVDYQDASYTNSTMLDLAGGLAARLDRDVIDKTGLTGRYDFHMKPLPYQHYDPKTTNVEDTDFSGIIEGVKNLGLRLEPGKADTTVIVIDHIDRPAEN
ncbi:MAG: TIGR03435 family protein [Acidobacteriaceae bacterium]